jgi:hypothetical protein
MLITHVIQDWNTPSSSSLPARIRRQTSRGFFAQGYSPYHGDSTPLGGQAIDNLTGGQQDWIPYNSMPPNPSQSQHSGHSQEIPDVRMGITTHLLNHRQQDDEGRSLAKAGWPQPQPHPSPRPRRWDVSRAPEGYPSQQVEEYAMGIPRDIHQPRGRACERFPL